MVAQKIEMRTGAIIALLSLSHPALADGSTAPTLAIVDFWAGAAAAIVFVVFEAWFIGVATGRSWPKSLALSALSNVASAVICPVVFPPDFYCPFFPLQTGLNPNPLLFVFELLLGYGLISVFIECPFWAQRQTILAKPYERQVFVRCLISHVVGVPLCLAIFLVPARPYHHLEYWVLHARRMQLWEPALLQFDQAAQAERRIPIVESVNDILNYTDHPDRDNQWLGEYMPNYSRFATGEDRSCPIRLDPASPGRRFDRAAGEIPLVYGSNGSFKFEYLYGPVGEVKMRPDEIYRLERLY